MTLNLTDLTDVLREGGTTRCMALRGEERLMIEVLARACTDVRLIACGAAAAHMRRSARAWIASDAEAWPLSFVRICRHFGIEPEAARGILLEGESSTLRHDRQLARCS